MQFKIGHLVFAGAFLAAQVDAGVIDWIKRQATCKECPLNPGNIVKEIVDMVSDTQSNKDCRWEHVFGLPQDLGGPEKPNYDHMIRVNYDENDNTCSVETNNRVEAMGDNIYCIAGGCGIKELTDTYAVVAWGACVIRDTIDFVPGQTMGTRECADATGEVKFARFHDSDTCKGSSVITQTVGGQDPNNFVPGDSRGGEFWGGVVTFCSTMSTGS